MLEKLLGNILKYILALMIVAMPLSVWAVSWEAASELGGGKNNALVIDPYAATTLYAGSSNGIYKSLNAGASWAFTPGTTFNVSSLVALSGLPASPAQTFLYAGSMGNGVWASSNAGASWVNITGVTIPLAGLLALGNLDVTSLVVNPITKQVYAGTLGGGVYTTGNGGQTWPTRNVGISDLNVLKMAIDPFVPTTLYCATKEGGIFKSVDSGASWVSSSTGLGSFQKTIAGVVTTVYFEPTSLFVSANAPNTLYIAQLGGGLSKSIDAGATWSVVPTTPVAAGNLIVGSKVLNAIALDSNPVSSMYLGSNAGVFKSLDTGLTWSTSRTSLSGLNVSTLTADKNTAGLLYAGTQGAGVFKSVNAAATWQTADSGMTNAVVRSVAFDPISDDPYTSSRAYVGTDGGGVFKTTSTGLNWAVKNVGLTDLAVRAVVSKTDIIRYDLPGLLNLPVTGTVVYAGTFAGGVFQSVDEGASWGAFSGGLTGAGLKVRGLTLDPVTGGTLYAATWGGGVFKTTRGTPPNLNTNWLLTDTGITTKFVYGVTIDPRNTSILYAATLAGVFKTVNAGVSWTPVNTGLTNLDVRAVSVDAANSSLIYAATWGGGVFRSLNAGASWVAMNTGIPDLFMHTVKADTTIPSTLYIGTNSSGIYRSADAGVTWISINNGVASTQIFDIALDPMDASFIYLGTGTAGVQRGQAAKPFGSLSINFGVSTTNTTAVGLSLTCSDGTGSGCQKMQLSHDNVTWQAWQTLAPSVAWTLVAGVDGVRDVYARFKDAIGIQSDTAHATILLDRVPPAAPVITGFLNNQVSAIQPAPAGQLDPYAALSGTAEANSLISVNNFGIFYGQATTDSNGNWTIEGRPIPAGYSFVGTAQDQAGNTGPSSAVFTNGLDGIAPVITLTGANPLVLLPGVAYVEPGSVVTDNVDVGLVATVTGTVGTAIGTYTRFYDVTDAAGNVATTVTRTVNVEADQTAPTITLTGSNFIFWPQGQAFVDPGSVVTDNLDTGLVATVTGAVNTAVIGVYTLTYNAMDSGGNPATPITRTVSVTDQTAPVITLNGAVDVYVEAGTVYIDAGATSTDAVSGTLNIVGVGIVNTALVGVYTLTYDRTDGAGNVASQVIRRVHVQNNASTVRLTLTGTAGFVDIYSAGQTLFGVSSKVATGNLPVNVSFPFGVIDYYTSVGVIGGFQTVRMTFSSVLPANLSLYKEDGLGNYTLLPTLFWTIVGVHSIDVLLRDGDALTDLDGIANGIIHDPLALGVVGAPAVTAAPVATSSGGSGGCVIQSQASFDPTFPLIVIFLALWRLFRRQVNQGDV